MHVSQPLIKLDQILLSLFESIINEGIFPNLFPYSRPTALNFFPDSFTFLRVNLLDSQLESCTDWAMIRAVRLVA